MIYVRNILDDQSTLVPSKPINRWTNLTDLLLIVTLVTLMFWGLTGMLIWKPRNTNKLVVHCDTCNVDILRANWDAHLQSKKHKNKLINPVIHCDTCNIDVLRGNWNDHLKSKKHTRNQFRELPQEYDVGEDYVEKPPFTIEEVQMRRHARFNTWITTYRVNCNSDLSIE